MKKLYTKSEIWFAVIAGSYALHLALAVNEKQNASA